MKQINIISIAIFILLFGCLKQNNEGYLEVINLSTDSIKIWGFGKGEEAIAVGDTSKLYTFELGEYDHKWYCVRASGKWISEKGPSFPQENYQYAENVCIHNGMKLTHEIHNVLDESSVTIINQTGSLISYCKSYRPDLMSFIEPGDSNRWDFNAPIDSGTYFDIYVQEPFVWDTIFVVLGGEHLRVEITPN